MKGVWLNRTTLLLLGLVFILIKINLSMHSYQIRKLEKELEAVTTLVAEIDTGCNKLSVYP